MSDPELHVRLFATAREAAGRGADTFDPRDAPTVAAVLVAATARYGPAFEAVLATARIWLNGDDPPEGLETAVRPGDEVAILPPVSGG